jgi:hypothetical protein
VRQRANNSTASVPDARCFVTLLAQALCPVFRSEELKDRRRDRSLARPHPDERRNTGHSAEHHARHKHRASG